MQLARGSEIDGNAAAFTAVSAMEPPMLPLPPDCFKATVRSARFDPRGVGLPVEGRAQHDVQRASRAGKRRKPA